MSDTQTALDYFGEVLMRQVRDQAIIDWDMIVDGRMKDVASEQIRRRLQDHRLTQDQIALVLSLVSEIVDTTLHHLLWTLEQEESINVAVKVHGAWVPSLREVSDGLAGELYEWIPRFSEERHDEI